MMTAKNWREFMSKELNNVDERTIYKFVDGYKKLCSELGVYLVFELDEYWLENSGEQLDTMEAVQGMHEVLFNGK
jgi:hypothetical protein